MERSCKLRRLDDFRRKVPHVSATALASILKEAREHGIPEISDRRAIREARDEQMQEVTPYGSALMELPVVLKDGSETSLLCVNPFAHLHLAARCEGFAALLQETLRTKACTFDQPWSLIIYSDEVVPGNQLAGHNSRKVWVLYWSLLEFGVATLSNEDAWFCIVAERTDRVKEMGGGIAQVFCAILKHMFSNDGHSFDRSAVLLDLCGGRTFRLFAKLTMILQDGGAHKQVYMSRAKQVTKCACNAATCIHRKAVLSARTKKSFWHAVR